MTSERIKKIEEIYHAVLETSPQNRKEFLQDHCGEDVELRLEIESLLSFEKTFDNVIDSTPRSLIKEVFFESQKPTIIGTRINQYKILSLLGEGGMGTVYLAQDTKLERKVAVKFLSDNFVKEGSSLERFFREARSSSALNHPNIITVHEIGEFENRPFIATEFIDGITLKEYLTQAKIPLADLIEIAVQVASALSTAHKAGIIHRDIKPDNVMIRSDGLVKVLDFGLAKISRESSKEIDTEANTQAKLSTIHGLIMGTPQFMSPEQARGKKVDKRTDIWSFGVLFYQMLTRKLPFQGETTSDIIASVLKSEPPSLTQFVPDISPELERITLKALRKRRSERYQTIDEILSELKIFRRDLEFGAKTEPLNSRVSEQVENKKDTDAKLIQITAENSDIHSSKLSSIFSQTIATAKTHPVSFGLIFITIASLFTAIVIGFSKQNSAVNQSDSFQKMKLAKLTFDGTVTNIAAVSPDGKYIVYALRNDGLESLSVRQIASGSVIQLVAPAEVTYFGAVFSNDSNYVYYTVYEKDASNLFEIPALGGNPRKIINDVSAKITFSPDGKTMAFIRSETSLMLADAKGGAERLLVKAADGERWRYADWNPNGKSIIVASNTESNEYLIEVAFDSGAAKRLDSANWTIITGLTRLSDGSGLILSGRNAETKFSQLWFLSYPDGKFSHITNDFSLYITPDLTADNKTLIAVKQEKLFNIWTSSDGTPNSLKKITVEEGKDDGLSGLAQAPGGKIVYTVRIDDAIDIWIVNADGSNNHQLTFEQESNFQPTVSPDGKYIVFTSNRTGKSNLWRMNIDGSEQTALTDNANGVHSPIFTPDGKWIIYEQVESNNLTTIWKINIEDKKTVQLTQADSSRAAVSPDGKFFACDYDDPSKLAVISIDGGQPVKILDAPLVLKSKMFLWAKDGKSLIYIDKRDRIYNLWAQPISGEKPKQLTFFDSGQIYKFDLAPDGKGFAFSRGNESSDVVMFNDFK